MTVSATTVSSAPQRNRRSRENLVLLDTVAEVIEVAVLGSERTAPVCSEQITRYSLPTGESR